LKKFTYTFVLITAACFSVSCSGDRSESDRFFNEGLKYYRSCNLDDAESMFSKAAECDKTNLNAYLMLSKIFYFKKMYDEALEYADKVLSSDENNTNALYWKSRILVMKNPLSPDVPLHFLSKILKKDTHHIPARLLLALLLEQKGENRKAMNHYAALVSEEEFIISAHLNLALLYRRMGFSKKSNNEIRISKKLAAATGKGKSKIRLIQNEVDKWEE